MGAVQKWASQAPWKEITLHVRQAPMDFPTSWTQAARSCNEVDAANNARAAESFRCIKMQ